MNVAKLEENSSIGYEPSKRSVTGIRGLDAVLGGGIPLGRTTIVVGGAGAGKTVLAAEYLLQGAVQFGEPGLLVSFEESAEAIGSNLRSLRLPFGEMFGSKLIVLDGRMPLDTVEAGSFDLTGLIALITAQKASFGLRRVVLDGIDALFAHSQNNGIIRRELLRLVQWLATSGLTAIVTVKSSRALLVPDSLEFLEYASDGVIRLDYRLDGHVLLRKLSIVKLRGCGYMGGEHGFILSDRGIELSQVERSKLVAPLSEARLSTGVEALDEMLGGGYREGTVTLISGLPGTAKTTLAGTFLSAGCAQGRPALLIGLDETPDQIMLDLRSVGLDLKKFEKQGLLHTASLNAGAVSIDEQFLDIQHLLERYDPALLVFDPISAYAKGSTGVGLVDEMTERLTSLMKARGITAIFTAVSDSRAGELESTSIRVSTVADTWIHVSYAVQRGERNRTLTIIKARGIAHSNQVRELILRSNGPILREIAFAQDAMLLGTARLEREQQERADVYGRRLEVERAIAALEARGLALASQNVETQRELAELERQKAEIRESARDLEATSVTDRGELLRNMETNPVTKPSRRRAAPLRTA